MLTKGRRTKRPTHGTKISHIKNVGYASLFFHPLLMKKNLYADCSVLQNMYHESGSYAKRNP